MSLLQELPTAVLHCIALYIPDGVTLCHFEGTCRNVRAAVQSTMDPWHALYCQRWSFRDTSVSFFDKQAYAERHAKDREAKQLCQSILQRATTADASEDVKAWEQANDKEFRRLFAMGTDIFDVCWTVHDQIESASDQERSRTLLLHLQFAAIITDLVNSIHLQRPALADERLEQLAIQASLLACNDAYRNFEQFAEEAIRAPLEAMAQKVRERLAGRSATTAQTIETLHQVFFFEEGFTGNADDYYNIENSFLNFALQRKRAIPMTLAILYKGVARRLNVEVDIIGLPGQIVVGIPALGYHVDVFNGGRVLQRENLIEICNSYGHTFDEELLHPLSPESTVSRIGHNIMTCVGRAAGNVTAAASPSALRLIMAISLNMTLRGPRHTEMVFGQCHMSLVGRWNRLYGRRDDE
ncbi:F-box protein 21 [Fistulifera solaris]|uniref:F-box protein 21 n=1 Tax=Fistulifera solaris TaxID=1519565 RepID=A0A1Z5KD22_FISSO|nr:F-box protein 21 [Fistulifera solaris]|eukprot:GAX24106.1 F-box protein 21 [Fistulifera solaris]